MTIPSEKRKQEIGLTMRGRSRLESLDVRILEIGMEQGI
jgi:hypothetical protein